MIRRVWRRCPNTDCDVRWQDHTLHCWACGAQGLTLQAAPQLTSQSGCSGTVLTTARRAELVRVAGIEPAPPAL